MSFSFYSFCLLVWPKFRNEKQVHSLTPLRYKINFCIQPGLKVFSTTSLPRFAFFPKVSEQMIFGEGVGQRRKFAKITLWEANECAKNRYKIPRDSCKKPLISYRCGLIKGLVSTSHQIQHTKNPIS